MWPDRARQALLASSLVVPIGLGAACTKFGVELGQSDDGVPTADAGVDGASAPDARMSDGATSPDPACPLTALYCEGFTYRNELAELGAESVLELNGTVALEGPYATAGRALRVTGSGSSAVDARLDFELPGALPPQMKLTYSLRVQAASFANLGILTFQKPGASDWLVYTYMKDGLLFVAEWQSTPSVFHDASLGRIDDGQAHTVTLRIDFARKTAFGSLDANADVPLSLTVPSGIASSRLTYGLYTEPSWSAQAADVVYDDVRVEAP